MENEFTIYRPGEKAIWDSLQYLGEVILTPIFIHWQIFACIYFTGFVIFFAASLFKPTLIKLRGESYFRLEKGICERIKEDGIGEHVYVGLLWVFHVIAIIIGPVVAILERVMWGKK